MKHVVAQADMMTGRRGAHAIVPLEEMRYLGRANTPTWLPVASVRTCRVATPRARSQARHATSIWLRPEPERLGEKLMMGGLVAAAVAGIAYGFNMVINLVEHWAVFQTNVAQALQ